jgi:hypothetical protein
MMSQKWSCEDAPFHIALDTATDEFVALIQGFVSFQVKGY